jgi:hypothetical protein
LIQGEHYTGTLSSAEGGVHPGSVRPLGIP